MERAFGGVIVNRDELVLLREPSHHYGGYVWTFAKGRAKPGESPEQAALREVLEETGVVAKVVAKLPGAFSGCLTVTEFFLMQPLEDTRHFSWETESVCWVTQAQASQMLAQTKHGAGRERDLEVLATAFGLLQCVRVAHNHLLVPPLLAAGDNLAIPRVSNREVLTNTSAENISPLSPEDQFDIVQAVARTSFGRLERFGKI